MNKYWNILFISLVLHMGLFLITNSFSVFAQNFEHFTNKEGFNQNTVTTIAQDSYGFLWFGTPNGLIKFDGYKFENFTTNSLSGSSISNNYINYLYNDDNGLLWIGTKDGLNVYIPWLEKFVTVPLASKISINHITSDSKGRIWVSGTNELFMCEIVDIPHGDFEISDNLLPIENKISNLNNFYFINDTLILLATSSGLKKMELGNYETPTVKSIIDFKDFNNQSITAIKKVKNMLWVGTIDGLYKTTLEGDKIHIIRKFETTKNKGVSNLGLFVECIFEDNNGAVWIGTKDEGLSKYIPENDRFDNYNYNPKKESGVNSQIVNCMYQDNFNVLWIGTAHGGINKLDLLQKPFNSYSHNPFDKLSISENLINSLLEDKDGYLWVSTYNESICRSTQPVDSTNINQLQFENLSHKIPLLKKDVIRSIYEDKKGFIWFGTDKSLMVYNPISKKFKLVNLEKNGKKIFLGICFSISQIDDTKLIFGGEKVLVVQNPWNQIKNQSEIILDVTASLDIDKQRVQAFLKDSRGKFWYGTPEGLLQGDYINNKLTIEKNYSSENTDNIALSHSNVFSLHEDDEGVLWIGTFGGGLNKMYLDALSNATKIDFFSKKNILPDDAVYGILQDTENYLWLSTDMGLCKFNKTKNTAKVFDVRDGLTHNNFRRSAFFKGKSGYFYFGGLNGLTIFNPEKIQINNLRPKVLITGLSIKNKLVHIGEKLNGKEILTKSISETKSISMNQNDQIIAFDLIVQHSATPSKNILAYKLEGFNDKWIVLEAGKTTVRFTNLEAGNYTFKTKGANSDGIWNTNTTDLVLNVLPPWYKTWWSYTILVCITLTIIIGVFVYFLKLEKLKQHLKYEELDKERIATINQGKFRYFTNLSHEFRTPLTLIAGPLERIMETNTNAKNNSYLEIIQKNTKRLLSLADQLITFREAEEGKVKLNLAKLSLGDFIYPSTEAFENYAIEKNINFFFKISNPNEEIVIDIEKVERIIFNLLSNSFKNTSPQDSIWIEAGVTLISDQKMITIDVVDTGKGIPKKSLEKIFERFYQLGNKEVSTSGGGIGLAFCKSLVNLMGGEISAQSQTDVETRFSVVIPSKPIEEAVLNQKHKVTESFISNWAPLTANIIPENNNLADSLAIKKHSILLVEDEPDIQSFLVNALSETYFITVANNGIEALESIKQKEPDLIVSDVMMPEMDGFEFCKEIKSNVKTCSLPVLLLTALGTNEDIIKGLEFGADEYLSKPFSLKHLELRIKKLLDNSIKIKSYFSKKSTLPEKGIEMNTKDKDFLSQVIEKIEQNLSDSNFGVEELANEIGLSTSQFYRKLKQLTGQVPNAYLRNFRLERAADLLNSNTGCNVAEVMYQIGIESHSYFSTSFKKLYGVSPSQYITKN
jgi:signal transduction histidine kinase/ligand-binding sensor domain-containing protein/DNA-binding response OmpR family regulator